MTSNWPNPFFQIMHLALFLFPLATTASAVMRDSAYGLYTSSSLTTRRNSVGTSHCFTSSASGAYVTTPSAPSSVAQSSSSASMGAQSPGVPDVSAGAQPIIQAIEGIESSLKQFNDTFNRLGNSDAITGIAILFQSSGLQKSVNHAAQTVDSSSQLTDTNSSVVANAVLALEPQICSVLDNVAAHQSQFKTVVLGLDGSFLIPINLRSIKDAADQFGQAIVSKLSPSYASAGPIVVQQIDQKFDQTIAVYS